jgi:hypothetical protein
LFSEGGSFLAEEKIFLNENRVSVTNLRMLHAGRSYPMSGVTSVKVSEKEPKLWGPLFLILMASLFLIGDLNTFLKTGNIKGMVISLIFLTVGIYWWQTSKSTNKTQYSIWLISASGEKKTYTSTDKEFVNKIVKAINKAIVYQG